MTIYENKGLLTYKDKDGDLYKMYPITRRDCVTGMEYIDEHIANKNNVHEVTTEQIGAVPIERTINDHALTDDIHLIPGDLGIELDTTLSVAGAYADAKAVGDANEEITSDVLFKHTKALEAAKEAKTVAESKVAMTPTTATLALGAWSNNKQTISVSGVTKNNTLIVGSHPTNVVEYAKSCVYCSSQDNGKMTFSCLVLPEKDLLINVAIFE